MEDLYKIIQDKIKEKLLKQEEKYQIKIIGENYFVISDSDEIESLNDRSILTKQNIKTAFIFPKIEYSPMIKRQVTYLKPIVIKINDNQEVLDGKLENGNWNIFFKDPVLSISPKAMELVIQRYHPNYTKTFFIEVNEFGELLQYLIKLIHCESIHEIELLDDNIKKAKMIDTLNENLETLKSDLNAKDIENQNIQEKLNAVFELVKP